MIYSFHIDDSRFVKIGFSASPDVKIRRAELQTGCPFEISTLFWVEGTLRQERAIHSSLRCAFARIRIPMPPNEWYPGRNPFFSEFLDHLRFGGANAAIFFAERYNSSVKQPGKKRSSLEPILKWPRLEKKR